MLAMIMAGGEGERLRPLTCSLPKPMALFFDRPILSYALELLKRHGIEQAGITLGYLPDAITEEFSDGSNFGIDLRYYTENRPLGTAGGIRLGKEFLKETFIVLSGDGITDVDLTEAVLFHKQKAALATIVLKRIASPTEYGLATTDSQGRITAFIEKPSWERVTSDLANTGIYILEPEVLETIPPDQPFDFGRDLFPLLLERGEKLFGYVTERYWCDIGDVSAYLQAHQAALEGRFSLISMPPNGILRLPGAVIDEDVTIEGPVFIGANARIHSGARILPGSVIGNQAVIGAGASIKRSIVYPRAIIQAHSELRGAVIAHNANLGPYSQVFEESVIGTETRLEGHVCVKPGIKIWPGKHVAPGITLYDNLVWGQRMARPFEGETLRAVSPSEALLAARAIAWKLKPHAILVGRSASSVAAAQERAVVSGFAAQGTQVYTTGECTLAQLRFLVGNMGLDGGIFVQTDSLVPIMSDETPLLSSEKRRIEGALLRQDMPLAYSGITRPIINAGRGDLSYLGFLKTACVGKIRRLSAAIYSQNNSLLYLAENAFQNAQIEARTEWEEELMELAGNEIGVYLSENGEKVRFAMASGALTAPQNDILMVWAMAAQGEKEIFLPMDATRVLEDMGDALGARFAYLSEPPDQFLRTLRTRSPYQFHMRMDGLFCALNVISHLNEASLSLESFIKQFPAIARSELEVEIPFAQRGEVLRRFRQTLPDRYQENDLFFRTENGWAWVRPDENRPVCTVVSEARDTEFAEELCQDVVKLLIKASKV